MYTDGVKNINLTLPEDLYAAIDRARGEQPRVVWIRKAAELRLEVRNLTNDEIARLLDDWRAAAEARGFDATDHAIAAKLAMQEENDGPQEKSQQSAIPRRPRR